ncbi:flagellar hook-basal body complex protein FliE [Alicyclobacillus fastidiosus]|uniref:Flagellar hook-basal body complex protein FliE n=1 Tax=Alicyclobacillus fastidiosus TaxID=392011 RepID=A0ABV5AHB0_9BACL|nr:flagellar hook-basal body complex protein FliE [Alicyclobacillus fastidiosus]WEH07930.1 flagellar hook-basal body complex protein FliE [Alicyclobacillus fastidiosus]
MAIQGVQSVLSGALGQMTSSTQAPASGQPSFSDFLAQELDKVNQVSDTADQLAQSYATGGSVTASQLMVAEQQASLAVDMVSQVASRVTSAYQTVMNMQV